MDKNEQQTYYVKLGEDGLPTGLFVPSHEYWNDDFYVGGDEHWVSIEATSENELQEKMKTFQKRSN